MLLRLCSLVFMNGLVSALLAQGPVITPLAGRYQPGMQASTGPVATIFPDTLILPFFEDFTATTGYPSQIRWAERDVWVNNNMAIDQPNYNVATFDHLDEKGRPYTTLNKNEMTYADSLTSFPIKLDFYKTGPSSTANYLPTDSIILSFFFQQKGTGDIPEAEDSLILRFLDKTGKWKTVWSVGGGSSGGFQQVLVPVNSFDYLHNAFQFRFINYTKSTGNLNHWNLDYIRLEKYKNRAGGNDLTDISDIGITTPDYRLFNTYYSMPYSHYKTNVSGLTKNQLSLTVRNMNTSPSKTTQTRFGLKVFNQYNSLVYEQALSASSRNILFNSDSTLPYPALQLDTFSGVNPRFSITYITEAQSNDETPDEYNAEGNNNELKTEHAFTPWYAYDDGNAEGGFGLDYAWLGNVKGQFAMKFSNLKADSLRGLAIYFNRSESDVSFRSFYVRIWKSISPLGQPDNKDELIYEQFVEKPLYTDSINHFSYIFFDTVIPLSQGIFYAGWRQNQPFILNVGFDNNYRFNGQETGNPNLFHNLLGSWEKSDLEIRGVPMIRPLLGTEKDYAFSVKKADAGSFAIYPNPASDKIYWKSGFQIDRIEVFDLQGRAVCTATGESGELSVDRLQSGTYFAVFKARNGQLYKTKLIKQ